MKTVNQIVYVIIYLIIALYITSCKCKSNHTDGLQDDSTFAEINGGVNPTQKVVKIFYNVPSPIEMANLLQRSGVTYDYTLVNPTEKAYKYTTNSDLALALGVYGADLSYTRIFDQLQQSVHYLSTIRKISEALGIPEEKGTRAVDRLENNLDNKDSLLLIISDTYANADLFLKENDRGSTAALIILGGWIEALHIAVNIIKPANPNKDIMERIAEQKYSLDNLIELFKTFPNDEVVNSYLPKLNELKEAFAKIPISVDKSEIITNVNTKTTILNNNTEIEVTFDNIIEIGKIVSKIRKEIVN